jgi:hypothetical protein
MGGTAFVLSRIGSKGSSERARADEVFKYVVAPAVGQYELTPMRSDHDPTPGPVTAQIVRSIIEAVVVIADVTGRNANVYYELGIAHSFGIPTVMLIDETASMVFDTQNERTIVLGAGESLSVTQADVAVKGLAEALGVVLRDGYQPRSVVTEAATTRSLDALAPENPQASELGAIREKLETTEKLLLSVHRRIPPPTVREDRDSLRKFVEQLVEADRLRPSELVGELVTPDTSRTFDSWVNRMTERATQVELANRGASFDPSEEPF